ncbi:CidA/LrgA family protein [Brucella anthropi]|jgi:holin-like protein|uniref:CidA/LrgA family protein n=3 Tax=Brucella TaxID=234 RepID=A0A011V8M3_BRUAN|nr:MULTISPECIES: CidA/LrgA family protein [Brucella/Ochrobactrum group]MCR5939444.1 CidA/LrgA family protein [Ochrobactrum sp. XJ1]QOD65904.1 CidA/LrgA family protein [Ochrobactrum sp. MT180101]QTN04568.1 CidA/LrgA family protein [Ochrobactrum sp. EEELCW01]RNL46639.1 CidA/LrgA family protein [Ochrobactrum sp. MH181795]EXL04785.1 LrgA [Brucella anthropi]
MIKGIALLLLFQLLGESFIFMSGLPIPGPVVGLVLLFVAMQLCKIFDWGIFAEAETAADGFLGNLGLLFVPAGVGVVAMWSQIQGQATAILAIVVISAILTLAVTVWTFILVQRFMGRR